jgi:hypothetical protein
MKQQFQDWPATQGEGVVGRKRRTGGLGHGQKPSSTLSSGSHAFHSVPPSVDLQLVLNVKDDKRKILECSKLNYHGQ